MHPNEFKINESDKSPAFGCILGKRKTLKFLVKHGLNKSTKICVGISRLGNGKQSQTLSLVSIFENKCHSPLYMSDR